MFRRLLVVARPCSATRRFLATAPPPAGRGAALAAALRQIESTYGKGSVMQLGKGPVVNVPVIRTGSLALDHALGVGGLPKGRVVEIYGPESSGKTTLALHVVAEAQKDGGTCCFIDAEHALSTEYARAVGVDLDALFLSQPDSGEQALEIADTLVRSGGVDVVVIDSVAALVPKAELEGDMGDAHIALQARLMSQALRKLTSSLSRSNTLIIFINQIRSKVGVMFGSPDVTSGGNALKFYASIRMEIRRTGQIKVGEEVVGNETRVKIVKNKLAPPFRVADFEMTFGLGINRAAEAVDMGVTWGVLKRSGAWYSISEPLLLASVNAALSGGADQVAPAAAAAEPGLASAPTGGKAAPRKKGAKVSKATAADFAALSAADLAVGTAEAGTLVVDPGAASASAATAAAAAVALGVPFLQGREKMKAFFQAHPAVLQVAVRSVKLAMRDAAGAGGASPPAAPAAASGGAPALVAAAAAFPGGGASAAAGEALLEDDGEDLLGGFGAGLPQELSPQ